MREKLNGQIIGRLTVDYAFKPVGQHLREGRCPSCEKKTLWTWIASPGMVQCDRVSKCGYQATTKELYPDLFEHLNKHYAPTEDNPNKTADAYLSLVRGFDLAKIKGWYEQGKYWHPNGDKGTATVRFYLDTEKTVYWERFIENVTVTDEHGDKAVRKSRFNKGFKGHWWQPPGFEIQEGDKVYLCEGIIDAISLLANGYKAVAIMSSGTFPDDAIKPHLGKNVTWILALDNDIAGRKATKKHALKLAELGQNTLCALSSEGQDKADWNDLHIRHKINPALMEDYLYYGALETAKNATDKALVMWQRNDNRRYFVFTFLNQTYSFKIDPEEYKKAYARAEERSADEQQANMEAFTHAATIADIATFRMEFLYYQRPANGEEGQYFFRMNFFNGAPPVSQAFGGSVFNAATDFNKKTLIHPGGQFTGSNKDIQTLYRNWLAANPPIIRILDYVGYDAETKAYVFPGYAVEGDQILKLNTDSYFRLKKIGIKTDADIKQKLTDTRPLDFLADYRTAFGTNGMIALCWWLGCLVVEQIRHKHNSYPFLQIIGEPDSGKSVMVSFLWKLLGKHGDAFNPNSSTIPGRIRKMAEVSNLPVVFNETDNENEAEQRHVKKFLWDEHKDLFEGEFGRVTGVKSQDNSTRKPVFKAGLMVVQNIPVQASDALRSRFVYINFDRSHHSPAGKLAADRLRELDLTDVSGFLLQVCQQSDAILKEYSKVFNTHVKTLQANPAIKMARICQNYAQMMALAECLRLVVPITDNDINEISDLLATRAEEWQTQLDEDHPIVQQFWAQYDYINERSRQISDGSVIIDENLVNHSRKPEQEIAINLEHFGQRCAELKLEQLHSRDLRLYLPSSRKRKFDRCAAVNSKIESRSVRCWIFKLGRG
ncbi:MAG: toprim domain-containing protein [Methylococcales bacterium]